jgi:hypothetical protein
LFVDSVGRAFAITSDLTDISTFPIWPVLTNVMKLRLLIKSRMIEKETRVITSANEYVKELTLISSGDIVNINQPCYYEMVPIPLHLHSNYDVEVPSSLAGILNDLKVKAATSVLFSLCQSKFNSIFSSGSATRPALQLDFGSPSDVIKFKAFKRTLYCLTSAEYFRDAIQLFKDHCAYSIDVDVESIEVVDRLRDPSPRCEIHFLPTAYGLLGPAAEFERFVNDYWSSPVSATIVWRKTAQTGRSHKPRHPLLPPIAPSLSSSSSTRKVDEDDILAMF